MKIRIKTIALCALVYCLIFGGALVYGIYKITSLGTEYENSRRILDEQQAKEKAYHDLVQIVTTTKDDRATLASFFITEKDTITFITSIEDYARGQNVQLETTQLAVEPRKEKTEKTLPAEPMLKIGFTFKGSETAVKNMVYFFEILPLHKTVPDLTVLELDDATWEGRIALEVTISS